MSLQAIKNKFTKKAEANPEEEEKEEEEAKAEEAPTEEKEEETKEEAKAEEPEEEEKDDESKAIAQAVIAERSRIKALADLSANYPIDRKLIYQAQFETGWDVGKTLEVSANRTQKKAAQTVQGLDEDAKEVPEIEGSSVNVSEQIDNIAREHAKALAKPKGLLK